jgi:hypothetical protein
MFKKQHNYSTMFLNISASSLVPPNNNNNNNSNNDNQYLYPAYSCEHLLAPPSYHSHHKSVPNVIYHSDGQVRINIRYLFD